MHRLRALLVQGDRQPPRVLHEGEEVGVGGARLRLEGVDERSDLLERHLQPLAVLALNAVLEVEGQRVDVAHALLCEEGRGGPEQLRVHVELVGLLQQAGDGHGVLRLDGLLEVELHRLRLLRWPLVSTTDCDRRTAGGREGSGGELRGGREAEERSGRRRRRSAGRLRP